MNAERFFPWIQKVTQTDGPNILRLKGIIAFAGDEERYVVQGVHMIVEGDHQRAWKDGEKRESRLVFIGRDLDREAVLLPTQAEAHVSPSPLEAHSRFKARGFKPTAREPHPAGRFRGPLKTSPLQGKAFEVE